MIEIKLPHYTIQVLPDGKRKIQSPRIAYEVQPDTVVGEIIEKLIEIGDYEDASLL